MQWNTFSIVVMLIALGAFSSCNKPLPEDSRYSDLEIEEYLQAPENQYSAEALKGNAIVLEFWATWCAPCVAVMPHLNNLADKFEGKPLKFISVTTQSKEVVDNFLQSNVIKGWVGLDTDRTVFSAFDVSYIPKTVLLYPDGTVAAVTHASKLDEDVLNRLLDYKPLNLEPDEEIKTVAQKQRNEEPGVKTSYRVNIGPADKKYGASRIGINEFKHDAIRLKEYLAKAYNMPYYQVIGKDSLMNRYLKVDIQAPGLNKEAFDELLKESIKNALGISIEHQRQPMEVYVVTAPEVPVKGLIKEDEAVTHLSNDDGFFAGSSARFSNLLKQVTEATGEIIVDETGLTEKYTWTVSYPPDNKLSVLDTLERNLGLKFRKDTIPIKVIKVVD